nr:uncharacterized protein LOC128695974 [Cherax quadricarinatus]
MKPVKDVDKIISNCFGNSNKVYNADTGNLKNRILLLALVVCVIIVIVKQDLHNNVSFFMEQDSYFSHNYLRLNFTLTLLSVTTTLPHLTNNEEKTTKKIPERCECKSGKHWADNVLVQQLDLTLPWLNTTTKEHLIKHHPNLPVNFLHKANKEGRCSLLPLLSSIQWVNIHWQKVTLNNTDILLYSAIYDPLPGGKPCVRLLGVTRNTKPPAGWCHLWFNTQQPPVVTRITNTGRWRCHLLPATI